MYASNFEYDGRLLSDLGFIVCRFDGAGSDDVEKGSELSFELASARNGARKYAAGASYKNTLSTTFQICKDPDFYKASEMEVTNEEFRMLGRWLNRSEFFGSAVLTTANRRRRNRGFAQASRSAVSRSTGRPTASSWK